MPGSDAAISLAGVSVRYGPVPALNDVSIDVAPGEAIALLGPSGCGKTTLLRVISGAVQAQGLRRVEGRVGVVYQDLKLLPWMTVLQNVLLGADKLATAKSHALALLEKVGISDKAGVYPYELSGGQRQRVAIVRALCSGAEILLLDEPFSALDFLARGRLLTLVRSLHRETGLSLVVVTHNIEDAIGLADRLVVMRDGRIVKDFRNDRDTPGGESEARTAILALFRRT